MMHSESIPSRLVLVFFTFFVMKAPMWRVCDAGVFPRYIQGIILEEFFLPRVGGVLGATQPPPPPYLI